MNNSKRIKKLTILSLLTAMAVVVNIIESWIPIIPGTAFKIGFANIVTLIVIFGYGPKEGVIVGLLRIFLGGLLSPVGFGPTFMLSLSGGLLSLLVMLTLSWINKFSITAVSVVSSFFHVLGQLFAAIFLFSDVVIYYGPIMLALSIPAGVLTGILATRFLKIGANLFDNKKSE